ncbi:ATP-binding protein [Streptomyces nogalater]
MDRATAVRPGFTLDGPAMTAIGEVVRRLDGLPLALELAAARLRSMDVEQIAHRLDDRFRLLATGNRAAQPRQRTLHAVIEWSWELLTGQERTLARRMAVFPAPTGADGVEAVCSGGTLPAGDVPYVLGSLVDKSFVERIGDGYRMLETVRAYAAERLLRAGEREAVRARLVRHFADVAREHEPLLRSARQQASFALFTAEYDNLVFALRAAVDGRDADAAARLLAPLYWYWASLRYDARAEALVAGVCGLGESLPGDARAAFTALRLLAGDGGPRRRPGTRRHRGLCAHRRFGALSDAAPGDASDGVSARSGRCGPAPDPRGARAPGPVGRGLHVPGGGLRAARAGRLGGPGGRDGRRPARVRGGWRPPVHGDGTGRRGTGPLRPGQASRGGRRLPARALLVPGDGVEARLGLAAERIRGGDLAGARHDIDAAEQSALDRGDDLVRLAVLACRAEWHRRAGEPERAGLQLDRMEALGREAALCDETVRDWVAPARVANLLAAGDAVRARELLPRAVRGAFAQRDAAPAAQQLAGVLLAEGIRPARPRRSG